MRKVLLACCAAALVALPAWGTEHGDAGATAEVAETSAAPVAADMPAGEVARSAFTTAVVDREPQDEIENLGTDQDQIAFFTELLDLQGQRVEHVWERDGEEMARVAFEVGGPRWRVHSTKNLEPSWVGRWTVRVVDGAGREIHSHSFDYMMVETSSPASMAE